MICVCVPLAFSSMGFSGIPIARKSNQLNEHAYLVQDMATDEHHCPLFRRHRPELSLGNRNSIDLNHTSVPVPARSEEPAESRVKGVTSAYRSRLP